MSNDPPPSVISQGQPSQATTSDIIPEGEISAPNSAPTPPQQEFSDLIRACQSGDLATVKDLIARGEASAQDATPEGTTALHWAAINNRLTVCRYLIETGAVVDAKGGELQATPLHWACRSGLVYIVHLLIQHGADPLRTDSQGFNALHLAVHSSNVLLVIYLLHQGIPVDTVDPHGRAPMHWAAYQGDALSVDCLLNWGASVKLTDSLGFTSLHWSIVKGNHTCMKRLIEEGSDVFAKNNDGKSPVVMAQEMHTVPAWLSALDEAGKLPNGASRTRIMTKKQVDITMFLVPFVFLGTTVWMLKTFVYYVAIPMMLLLYAGFLQISKRFILPNAYYGRGTLMKTPFLAGIFAGSSFWTIIRYLATILPTTVIEAPTANIVFVLVFGTVLYSFFRAMLMDPGYVPKLSGITEQKQVIEELIDRGEYDSRNFCIMTYIHKPLRSKYDKSSKRVVARFDHYCPWVNNVIGVRNHRLFCVYIISLFIGLPLLGYIFFAHYVPSLPEAQECPVAPGFLCRALTSDSFTTQIVVWGLLQMSWVTILVFVQLVQIGRSLTTNEASNLHRFGFLGADDFSSLPMDHHAHSSNVTPATPGESVAFAAARRKKWYSSLLKLLGIDQFISTAQDLGQNRARRSSNPADYGVWRNCMDFWNPNGLGWNPFAVYNSGEGTLNGEKVDYYMLYEFPVKNSAGRRNGTHDYEMVEQV